MLFVVMVALKTSDVGAGIVSNMFTGEYLEKANEVLSIYNMLIIYGVALVVFIYALTKASKILPITIQ